MLTHRNISLWKYFDPIEKNIFPCMKSTYPSRKVVINVSPLHLQPFWMQLPFCSYFLINISELQPLQVRGTLFSFFPFVTTTIGLLILNKDYKINFGLFTKSRSFHEYLHASWVKNGTVNLANGKLL